MEDRPQAADDAPPNVVGQTRPTLGIDLDGCCDESAFFRILSRCWPGDVVVITFRDDRQKAEADLERHGIRYTEVVLVDSFDAKAKVIVEQGVSFYIDDQPEMLADVPASVGVLLFRNAGNHDFGDRKWMFSKRTGKLI